AIKENYPCEAIAIIESVITDRLESRLSYLERTNVGFETLGPLIQRLNRIETDTELRNMLGHLDGWRERRNVAIHELVKIESGAPGASWPERILALQNTADDGYELLKAVYTRVAELNPLHTAHVFAPPSKWPPPN